MNEKLNKTNNHSTAFGVKTTIALILIAFILLSSLVYGLGLLISPLNANGPHSTQQSGNRHETITTGRTPQAPSNFRILRQENGRPVLAWINCNYTLWSSIRWSSSDGRNGTLHNRIGTSSIRVDGSMRPNITYTFFVRGYNTATVHGEETSFAMMNGVVARNEGVYRIRNGTGNFLATNNGHNDTGTNAVIDSRQQDAAWQAIGQNFRIEFHPAHNAYTIAPIAHANGFRRVLSAERLTAHTSNSQNRFRVASRNLSNANDRNRQMFLIAPMAGGGYSIRPLGNTSLALTRVGGVGTVTRFETFNANNAYQRWHLERNVAYEEQENYYAELGWHWPVCHNRMPAASRYTVSSSFHNRQSTGSFHGGIDIGPGGRGSGEHRLLAVYDGYVVSAGFGRTQLGYWVRVSLNQTSHNSSQRIEVRYVHMHAETPIRGRGRDNASARVVGGQTVVGHMGNTPLPPAPGQPNPDRIPRLTVHLHLDVFVAPSTSVLGFTDAVGTRTNPLQFYNNIRDRFGA